MPLHVWVNTGPHWTTSSVRRGLLVAWRPVSKAGQPGDWEGYVIAAYSYPTGGGSEVTVTQGWLIKAHIRPAGKR